MDGAFGNQDYGMEGGRGGRGGGRTGFRGTAENAKTKLCNRLEFISCRLPDLPVLDNANDVTGGCREIAALEIGATSHMGRQS